MLITIIQKRRCKSEHFSATKQRRFIQTDIMGKTVKTIYGGSSNGIRMRNKRDFREGITNLC